jgi:hypothetical protein
MGWVWCLRCNRTFRDEDYRRARDNYRRCAYPDCAGLAPFDMIDWRDIRLLCAEYPQTPEPGRAYGLPTPIP